MSMTSDWKSFLAAVDETPPEAAILKEATEFLLAAKFADPQSASGITIERLEKSPSYPTTLPTQAFLGRTMDTLAAVTAARRVALGASAMAAGSAAAPSTNSALALASMIAPLKTADTSSILSTAGMSDLPFAMRIEQGLVDKMSAETEQARRQGRTRFLYVELASREVLPLWITPESVGGRPEEDAEQLEDQSVTSLARLGQALHKATEGKRCFTSVTQWSSVLQVRSFRSCLGAPFLGTSYDACADRAENRRGREGRRPRPNHGLRVRGHVKEAVGEAISGQ